ncbi:S8 family serine peptidase [Halosegnis sp.]|uniref:S8 family peptidase n=1 Tax=Halosegnis sp. TaxID=2864959 RepID=UPI0035D5163E
MTPPLTRRSLLGTVGSASALAFGPRLATATAADKRFIVDTRENVRLGDARVVHDLNPVDALVVETNDPATLDGRYAPDVGLALDLPVDAQSYGATAASVDALSEFQWDKSSQRVSMVHDHTTGGGTRVAVIDTGIAAAHPDLGDAVDRRRSRNFTDDGGDFTDVGYHGTHVSSIIAGATRDGRGVLGTAPDTDLVVCRVFSGRGTTSFGTILAAMVYAARVGCDAANMSLGAYPMPLADDDIQVLLDLFDRATTFGRERGTLFVAAAGNAGVNLDEDGPLISLPAEADDVVSVSATGPIGFRWDDDPGEDDPLDDLRRSTHTPAFYTNYGERAIDLSAPGGNADTDAMGSGEAWFLDLVFGAVPGGYAWLAGTSMAAPQVTGTVALVRSRHPNLSAPDVARHLTATAEGASAQQYHGAGHLDTRAAATQEIEFRDG